MNLDHLFNDWAEYELNEIISVDDIDTREALMRAYQEEENFEKEN